MTLMIGGRNLVPGGAPARVRVAVDGAAVDELVAAPGFFLQMLTVPPSRRDQATTRELTVESDSPQLAIEQFDAQPAGRVVFGFGDGWNEQEYNPTTGELWRWSSDRSAIRVRERRARASRSPSAAKSRRRRRHTSSSAPAMPSSPQFDVGRSFTRTVLIPATSLPGPEDTITIETSAWYVPAEKRWRSRDRRRLGLKLFECRVTPAS